MKKFLLIISVILVLSLLCACEEGKTKNEGKNETNTTSNSSIGSTIVKEAVDAYNSSGENKSGESEKVSKFGDVKRYSEVKDNPVVTIEMEDGGKIVVELYPQIAPNSVENFVSLIKSGFYSGLIFHRVIPGFMAQGGCPLGNGTGDPGYSIPGEFKDNGFNNTLSHDVGVISMARAGDPDSAGSQFFIVTDENAKASLDDKYAPFGKVIEGMDEVMKIVNAKCEHTSEEAQNAYLKAMSGQELTEIEEKLLYTLMGYDTGLTLDRPIEEQKIKTVTVDTKGVEYSEPNKI